MSSAVRLVAQPHVDLGTVPRASGRWSWPPARSGIRSVRPQLAVPGRRPRRGGRPAFPSLSSRATRSGISCRVGCGLGGCVRAAVGEQAQQATHLGQAAAAGRLDRATAPRVPGPGQVSSARWAPCAWITITPMLCATRSCSSRAMRARSSATARAACSCLSRSASSARSINAAAACARRCIHRPNPHTPSRMNHAGTTSSQGAPSRSRGMSTRIACSATNAGPTKVDGDGACAPTAYRAMTTAKKG